MCSIKNIFRNNFAIFTEKTPALDSLFNKVAGLIKKRLQHRCFPVNILKLFRTPCLRNMCQRLHLWPESCSENFNKKKRKKVRKKYREFRSRMLCK